LKEMVDAKEFEVGKIAKFIFDKRIYPPVLNTSEFISKRQKVVYGMYFTIQQWINSDKKIIVPNISDEPFVLDLRPFIERILEKNWSGLELFEKAVNYVMKIQPDSLYLGEAKITDSTVWFVGLASMWQLISDKKDISIGGESNSIITQAIGQEKDVSLLKEYKIDLVVIVANYCEVDVVLSVLNALHPVTLTLEDYSGVCVHCWDMTASFKCGLVILNNKWFKEVKPLTGQVLRATQPKYVCTIGCCTGLESDLRKVIMFNEAVLFDPRLKSVELDYEDAVLKCSDPFYSSHDNFWNLIKS